MPVSNVVRFTVKPGFEQEFIEAHRAPLAEPWAGLTNAFLVRTGERGFCFVGEWESLEAMASARPAMIAQLDRMRHMLEDLGGGLGVTDPVSGEIVVKMKAPVPA